MVFKKITVTNLISGMAPVLCPMYSAGPGWGEDRLERPEGVLHQEHLNTRTIPGEPAPAGDQVLHLDLLQPEEP